jgi:para-aminobenzoate synthetase component 1
LLTKAGTADLDGAPLDILTERLRAGCRRFPKGAAVGWLAYDFGRRFEALPASAPADLPVPDLCFAFYPELRALASTETADGGAPQVVCRRPIGARRAADVRESLGRERYLASVTEVQELIARGDIYQANLTQRFEVPMQASAADAYCRLRERARAPYSALMRFGEVTVLSASPECFLSYDSATRRVQTRPIKGTRPRSPDPAEDQRLAQELLSSEKDRAENVMIVDVHRNDLGRVCIPGSVRVPQLLGLESHPTVHHLVSAVEGTLRPGLNAADLLRATFPAGSITGAPKIRAMQVLTDLEPVRRGIYTGALGILHFNGSLELSVAIRTLVARDGRVTLGAGGGIVADSQPSHEYEECLLKARALLEAVVG